MVTIIGAGPAGCYLGYLLAKEGKDVSIVEEHAEIGKPVQCTGIVTSSIEKFVKLKKDLIANRMGKVAVFSRSRNFEAPVNEIVLWRNKLDEFLSDKAVAEGANIFRGHKFISFGGKNIVRVKDKKNGKVRKIKSDIIVGADGPFSSVAKAAVLLKNRKFYIGIQAKVKLKIDTDKFETYFGENFPDFFGWCVPESEDTVRLGLGTFSNAKALFYNFLKKRTGKKKVICWQSGIIPLYNPNQPIQRGNIYLIGDAAAQVKATTGGGIIPSLKAAHTLCDCIVSKKDYNKEYKKQSGRELLLHYQIRKILNKFSDADYDKLLKMMDQDKIKKILGKFDRDSPIPLVANALLKEPRFLFFAKVLFNNWKAD